MDQRTLVLFAKLPTAGQSKTRLISEIGAAHAAALSAAFLLDLAQRLKQLDSGIRKILCIDPPDSEPEFTALLGADLAAAFTFMPQGSGDLGTRLGTALSMVRATAPGPVAFIGSDAPDLPPQAIEQSFIHAAAGEAFVMPAWDGGYVLLTLPSAAPLQVFDNVAWSTNQTCHQQIRQLRALNIPTAIGEKWHDVDNRDGLIAIYNRLKQNPALAPKTWAVLSKRSQVDKIE